MKKKAIPPFTLTAGQSGRLLFTFTLPEGTAKPNLRGALMVHGQKVDMQVGDDDSLTIPPLPAGVYLAEVRAAGMCVLYGHVEVLPSPLFEDSGMAAYRVDVDNTTDVLQVSLSMVEGIPGMQGAQGEQGVKGDTGASAYQLAVQYGYPGTEAEWIAELQGAQAAAAQAKESALQASSRATNADASAELASEHAAEAAGSATDAQQAQQAAEHAAEQAAATTANTAKTTQNNTFTGTNTFNGVLVANQGAKVNYVEPAFNSVLPSNAMSTIGLLNESLIKEIDVKGSRVSTTGTFSDGLELSGGTAEAPAVMQKIYYGRSFLNAYKSYADYHTLVLPIEADNCDFRVMLVMNNSQNTHHVQYTDITKPFFSWEKIQASVSYEHFHAFEVYVTRQSGQQSIHCTTRWREGDNVLGVREFGCRLNNGNLSSNYTGITHLFFMRESKGIGLYALFSFPSIQFIRVGSFDCRGSLFSSPESRSLLVGATGSVKLKNIKMAAAISGAGYPNFPYPLSTTYDAYENLLTFEEYKQKYGITDATE